MTRACWEAGQVRSSARLAIRLAAVGGLAAVIRLAAASGLGAANRLAAGGMEASGSAMASGSAAATRRVVARAVVELAAGVIDRAPRAKLKSRMIPSRSPD